MKFIGIKQASNILGVTPKTLRLWEKEGKIDSYKTPGNHRKYLEQEILEFIGKKVNASSYDDSSKNKVYIYGRVSTKKQFDSGNLGRQLERLNQYCCENNYVVVNTFKEVASGINENRKQLNKMLNNLRNVDKIIAEYPDRLARFGLMYIKMIAGQNNVEIEFIENNPSSSANDEMTQDIVSIITCFSAKIYGARGGRKAKEILKKLDESI